jgi:RimJ/RimL family protein N-acetyltransferase
VPDVRVEPWPGDVALLQGLLGDPAMMLHLGGPETPEKIASRDVDYSRLDSRQYRIVVDDAGAGWVGYWPREWQGQQVFEIGWSVLPAFQGRGLASAGAAAVLAAVRDEEQPRDVHAFPSVDNAPSNGICRKLGFDLLGEVEFEYPKGHLMRCNDWRLVTG